MKFETVTEAHIREALVDFEKRGLPDGFRESTGFDVEVDGKLYPPKPLMAYANQRATGEPLLNNFRGGRNTDCFKAFGRLGFRVIPRANPADLAVWVNRYIELISNEGKGNSYNELYKWEAVKWFQSHWTDQLEASNVLDVIGDAFSKSGNLLSGQHFLPLKMLLEMARVNPERTSQALRELFDEAMELEKRLLNFEEFGRWYLKEYRPGEKISHYQSDRAMMAYLTMRYPKKYFLYKNGMFNKFCALTGFWPKYGSARRGSNEVVFDFMSMCEALKIVLLSNANLMEAHRARIPEDFALEDDSNLLVQDFVYSVGTYLSAAPEQDEDLAKEMKEHFRRWLLEEQGVQSSTASSYLRAIELLELHFAVKVYGQNQAQLESLYADLKANQRTQKYHHPEASSYGKHYFYSAAIDQFIRFLNRHGDVAATSELNQIFFGPPGTGKTFNTINEAVKIAAPDFFAENENHRSEVRQRFDELLISEGEHEDGQIGFTTFHQSMSYEDFIEGIKPARPREGDAYLKYDIEEGIFKKMCRLAEENEGKNYVLIIDEINRGNVSAIFGELITLIEPNKRAGTEEALEVVLPYSKKIFSVPKNLYLIGTMNTADRSVEALDSALRRRFAFTEMAPDANVIAQHGELSESNGILEEAGVKVDLVKLLETINARIEVLRDKDCLIGHSYLMEVKTLADLRRAFKDKIIPLLQEYFFADLGKMSLILGPSFVTAEGADRIGFAKGHDYDGMLVNELQERKVYRLTSPDTWDFEQIIA